MKISYDPNKSQRNIELRQLSFDEVENFEWNTAFIRPDLRFDYSEPRFTALGFIQERLHLVVFTPRNDGLRIISFRKENRREIKIYENAFTR